MSSIPPSLSNQLDIYVYYPIWIGWMSYEYDISSSSGYSLLGHHTGSTVSTSLTNQWGNQIFMIGIGFLCQVHQCLAWGHLDRRWGLNRQPCDQLTTWATKRHHLMQFILMLLYLHDISFLMGTELYYQTVTTPWHQCDWPQLLPTPNAHTDVWCMRTKY